MRAIGRCRKVFRVGVPERQLGTALGNELWLSFDLFHAIEGGDAKIAESHRFTFLVVVVVIFDDDSRLLPSPSDGPTDSNGSSFSPHPVDRPMRMLLVHYIAADAPLTVRNRHP